jgi:hypothetical protein
MSDIESTFTGSRFGLNTNNLHYLSNTKHKQNVVVNTCSSVNSPLSHSINPICSSDGSLYVPVGFACLVRSFKMFFLSMASRSSASES